MDIDTYELTAAVLGGQAYEDGLEQSPCTDDNLLMLLQEAAKNGIDNGELLVRTWRANWIYRQQRLKNS